MLTIPAKIAGVKRVAACSPANKQFGTIHPATLVAMDIAGADEIYQYIPGLPFHQPQSTLHWGPQENQFLPFPLPDALLPLHNGFRVRRSNQPLPMKRRLSIWKYIRRILKNTAKNCISSVPSLSGRMRLWHWETTAPAPTIPCPP